MKRILIKLIATSFGVGYSPLLPGTLGSLWGVLFCYLLRDTSVAYHAALFLLVTSISFYTAHKAEEIFGETDCQRIVIDEVAGQLLTYLFVPFSFFNLVAGFLLFRFFDMTKIWPTNWIQNNVPGGFGVVADDLMAAIQAGLVLSILNFLI